MTPPNLVFTSRLAELEDKIEASRQDASDDLGDIRDEIRDMGFVLVRVIAAGADFQRLGQGLDLLFGFQGVQELEAPFRFPSETMAKAFFKMSRCRRR